MGALSVQERNNLLLCTELTSEELDNLPTLTAEQAETLRGLSANIQNCRRMLAMQYVQLGYFFKQARSQIDDGNWRVWLYQNEFSYRSAMQCIQVSERFGNMMEKLQGVQISNILRCVTLERGTEQKFLESHDLQHMTARETQQAVKDWNEEHRPKQQTLDVGLDEHPKAEETPAHDMAQEIADLKNQLAEAKKAHEDFVSDVQEEAFKRDQELQAANNMVNQLQDQLNKTNHSELDAERAAVQNTAIPLHDKQDGTAFAYDMISLKGRYASLPNQLGKFSRMPHVEKQTIMEAIKEMQDWLSKLAAAVGIEDVEGVVIS